MRNISRYKPSPAMVVAMIALFVALGGTGYAINKLNINAAQVNGFSAVSGNARISTSPGKLAALNKSGINKGKFNTRFLPQVGSAKNAVALGGLTPAVVAAGGNCKTGTVASPVSRVCVETTTRTADTISNAYTKCLNESGFLPQVIDMFALLKTAKITVPATEWTGFVVNTTGASIDVQTFNSSGPVTFLPFDGAGTNVYRCAFFPSVS